VRAWAGYAAPTLLLWVSFFMCFALLIVLVLWTPTLMGKAGIGETGAAMIAGPGLALAGPAEEVAGPAGVIGRAGHPGH